MGGTGAKTSRRLRRPAGSPRTMRSSHARAERSTSPRVTVAFVLGRPARGLDVLAIDISSVGLARIDASRVTTHQQDLARDPTLPSRAFDLVMLFHYWQPSLHHAMVDALAPGGFLLAEIATVDNLTRHAHPSRRWLVEPGDLRRAAHPLEIVHYAEGWLDDRHTARLIARSR